MSASAAHIIAEAVAGGRHSLDEAAAKRVVATFGIPVPRCEIARDADDAAKKAVGLHTPLAVKVVSAAILHKSDVGGVRLGLAGPEEVRNAVREMSRLPGIANQRIDGWLVEEMAPKGQELVIGAFRDPQFGPIVMVGLGGIFVEIIEDVAFRLCPIERQDAEAMIASLRGARLFDGARGREPIDRAAVVAALLAIGGRDGLMARLDSIAELDINPVLVGSRGLTAVDARIILEPRREAAAPERPGAGVPVLERFRPLFEPRTVAVLGASAKGSNTLANTFIRRLKVFGYRGTIYPIHPEAREIEGLTAHKSLGSTPEPVDYAFVAVGAGRIAAALGEARGRVRFAQVISSGFAEVDGGQAIERDLVSKARAAGVRVIGPNCLGSYSPRGGLTFSEDAPCEAGAIGLISQSGGLTTNMIRRGSLKGIRFSGAVSVGNCADVVPSELLGYYLADPHTKAIGCYLEDIKDGRAFFELLRSPLASKPVVLLRGGRSAQGRLAAQSHTGALAGDSRAWEGLALQTPTVEVGTLDEFLDTLLALQELQLRPSRPTRRVVMFGNGGGSSVLGADVLAAQGLDVSPFQGEIRKRLEALDLPPGSSVLNPIDTPVATLQQNAGKVARQILELIYDLAQPDAIALHLNMSSFSGRGGVDPVDDIFLFVAEAMAAHPGVAHVLMAFRTDGDPDLEERKRRYLETARRIHVPLFGEIPELAKALGAIAHLERRLASRGAG